VDDDLPCADPKLLVPLKRSRSYGMIRPRVADLRPIDSWQQDELHFFVFGLRPLDGAVLPEPPLAVFAMHPTVAEPISGVVVTPVGTGEDAQIMDLRQPEQVYSAPLTA
jgi:hypothetical protein